MAGDQGRDREQARPQVGSILFEPEAGAELYEAAAWYDAHQSGLGVRFLDEVENLLRAAAHRPSAFPRVATTRPQREVRRALLRRFPFAVVYFVIGSEISVVAVPHSKRSPGYWLYRIAPDK